MYNTIFASAQDQNLILWLEWEIYLDDVAARRGEQFAQMVWKEALEKAEQAVVEFTRRETVALYWEVFADSQTEVASEVWGDMMKVLEA